MCAIPAAAVGAVISAAIYVLQATINNNFSLGGFAKSILLGAATGAVSAGLGEVFSASGFWSTVANGALTGAGTGGVTALITGQNFLEGVLKGAVIGGGVAAVSYTVNFYANAKTERLTEADLNLSNSQTPMTNPSTDPDVLNDRIKTFRENNYSNSQIKKYGVNGEQVDVSSINNPEGYMKGGVIAVTKPNFFSNTSNITYSARAANTPYLLGKTMAHETAHSYVNKLTRVIPTSGNRLNSGLKDSRLDTVEHLAIKKLENLYYNINLNGVNMKGLNIVPLQQVNNMINGLSPVMKAQVESWVEKLYEVFNRKVTYQGISW